MSVPAEAQRVCSIEDESFVAEPLASRPLAAKSLARALPGSVRSWLLAGTEAEAVQSDGEFSSKAKWSSWKCLATLMPRGITFHASWVSAQVLEREMLSLCTAHLPGSLAPKQSNAKQSRRHRIMPSNRSERETRGNTGSAGFWGTHIARRRLYLPEYFYAAHPAQAPWRCPGLKGISGMPEVPICLLLKSARALATTRGFCVQLEAVSQEFHRTGHGQRPGRARDLAGGRHQLRLDPVNCLSSCQAFSNSFLMILVTELGLGPMRRIQTRT